MVTLAMQTGFLVVVKWRVDKPFQCGLLLLPVQNADCDRISFMLCFFDRLIIHIDRIEAEARRNRQLKDESTGHRKQSMWGAAFRDTRLVRPRS